AIHGVAQVFEHLFIKKRLDYRRHQNKFLLSLTWSTGWIYTFFIVFTAWVFFRSADINQALNIVEAMLTPQALNIPALSSEIKQISFLALLLAILQIPTNWALKQLREERWSPATSLTVAFWSLVAAVIFGAPVAVPFIYFQF
ncbi:MAG TPA: hypothetical protein VFM32_00645, partial [Spongiibacteraceae bacterium]|nr:hypothetical protein [Spongiibacteraceae bacterium]